MWSNLILRVFLFLLSFGAFFVKLYLLSEDSLLALLMMEAMLLTVNLWILDALCAI